MRRVLTFVLLLTGLLASPLRAQDQLTDGDRTAIVGIIEQQLAAFQADDGALAFSFASPTIQRLFQTADNFMTMVRTGYPPVYRPRTHEFLDPVLTEGGWTQPVLLVGPDGVPVIADYFMELQPEGQWLINGCSLRREPQQAA